MSPDVFFDKVKAAWSIESASTWTPQNPAKGQCSVTALVAQDVLGGILLKTLTPEGMHFYNLIDGVRWDFTISQFDRPIPFGDLPTSRDEAMADTNPAQYEALKRRITD